MIFNFSKIHIFGCFQGFWRSNWNSKASFKLGLITINVLPVKKSMKNAFLDFHIFTEYNLSFFIEVILDVIASPQFCIPSCPCRRCSACRGSRGGSCGWSAWRCRATAPCTAWRRAAPPAGAASCTAGYLQHGHGHQQTCERCLTRSQLFRFTVRFTLWNC